MDSATYWTAPSNYSMALYEPRLPYYYPNNGLIERSSMMKQMKACIGFDNVISDAAVMSFAFGLVSSIMGLLTFSLSLVNQLQTNFSAYWVGLPTAILTLLGDNAPPFFTRLWSYIGILDVTAVLNIFGPLGDFINFIDYFGNGLGLISLALSAFSTFPDDSRTIIDALIDGDFKSLVAGYRCPSVNSVINFHRNDYSRYDF